jgi:hypothetical protein
MLACCAQTTEGTGIGGEILLILALELLDEVVDETVVEVVHHSSGCHRQWP